MNRKILVIILLLNCSVKLNAQSKQDTVAILKELKEVMAFSQKPVISYETETRVSSVPVLSEEDGLIINGKFVKKGRQIYYRSGDDEMIVSDSLLFQVSHKRKSIWILRLTKKQMDEIEGALPGNKDLLSGLDYYTIHRDIQDNQRSIVSFLSKNKSAEGSNTQTTIQYNRGQMYPEVLKMEVTLKEQADEELLAALIADGIDTAGLIVKEGNNLMLLRKQSVSISLKNFSVDEKNLLIPSPYDYVNRDFATEEPVAIGVYADYEVRKLF